MKFPRVKEWVRVEGREGLFVVISIDSVAGVAELKGEDIGRVGLVIALDAIKPLGTRAEKYRLPDAHS